MSFYTGMSDGMPIGNFFFDHQIGKSYSISYMVVMNLDGTVRDVETLVYREPRGWEVRYPFFSWTSSRGQPQTQVFATLTPSLPRPFLFRRC